MGSALALTLSAPASAQEFLHDTRVGQGGGVQAGGFEVHPGLAAEVGWQDNYYGRSDKTGIEIANGAPAHPPIDTGMLRVTPSLALQMAPKSASGAGGPFALQLGASGTYREFFNPALSNQRNMSANANAGIAILPGHEWSGSISGTYARTVQPTVLGNPDVSYNNDSVTATADLGAQPNLGTLTWHAGYTLAGTLFEQSSGSPYNNFINSGYMRGSWRFRPRTALVFDGVVSYQNFQNTAGAGFALHQQIPVHVRMGLEGLVTPFLSVRAMVGYGTTLAQANYPGDPVQQYDSVIANVEARFFPSGPPTNAPGAPAGGKKSLLISSIALGYNRDFSTSYMGGFIGLDRGYLKAEYFFGGSFLVTLSGGVGAIEHPNIYYGSSTAGANTTGVLMAKAFDDVNADATLFLEYRLLPSLGINATGTYTQTFSNTPLPVAPTSNLVFDQNIRDMTAFLGVRWFM
jgi:hypothetical protein